MALYRDFLSWDSNGSFGGTAVSSGCEEITPIISKREVSSFCVGDDRTHPPSINRERIKIIRIILVRTMGF
jgi:hypothetical protein